jgi:hypothetical protein
LTHGGFRRASNREFFEVPVSDAVKAVVAAQAVFPTAAPNNFSDESDGLATGGVDALCDFADDLYFGRGEMLEDEDRAIDIYRKTAAAGSFRGVLGLARAWFYRESAVPWAEVRIALQRAIDAGVIEADAYMALGMIRLNHSQNTRKCWDRFFANYAQLSDRMRAIWACRYIRFMSDSGPRR